MGYILVIGFWGNSFNAIRSHPAGFRPAVLRNLRPDTPLVCAPLQAQHPHINNFPRILRRCHGYDCIKVPPPQHLDCEGNHPSKPPPLTYCGTFNAISCQSVTWHYRTLFSLVVIIEIINRHQHSHSFCFPPSRAISKLGFWFQIRLATRFPAKAGFPALFIMVCGSKPEEYIGISRI